MSDPRDVSYPVGTGADGQGNGNGKAKTNHLHDDIPRKSERAKHRHHDQGSAGDHRPGIGHPFPDAPCVVAGLVDDRPNADEQEYFVVHA